ncbi:MarR family winged helix-turn-helix transcriptional regulator [Fulvivirga lutimaris]|uniref:MarR family winged helix-turn-helix transcriptional regulator n=1 Tax=Fulvivirga lutimaris TaxID=1819566 RepID=UPI0012BB9A77|nr:MarR family transcriptional regulator [Fulvivirga lutimaris]MTI39427.1 MarR family transcriptional regulator [Fulvivirga lutimaris]
MTGGKIEDVILFQIEKTSKISKVYSQRDFDRLGLGITIEQWILLKIIEEFDQMSQKELAEKSLRDPASITRTLDLLSKKGLIERQAIENNRRQYNIKLTSTGKKFIVDNFGTVQAHRSKSVEGFTSEELKTLEGMLKRIQSNMS